jgi:hypothetical protein
MHRVGVGTAASKKNVVAGAIRLSRRRNHQSARNDVEMTVSDANRSNSNKLVSKDKLRDNNVRINGVEMISNDKPSSNNGRLKINSALSSNANRNESEARSNVRINGVEMTSNDKPSNNNGRLKINSALTNNARRNENEARSSVRTHGAETTSSDVVMNSARIRNGRRRNVTVWNWSVRGSNRISDRTCGAEMISGAETMAARISLRNNAAKFSDNETANKDRNPIAGVDRDNATIQTGNVDNRMCYGSANFSIASAGNSNNASSSSANASYSSRDVCSVGGLSSATGNDNDRISFVYRTSGTTTMAIPIIVTLGKAPIMRLLSMVLTSYGAPLTTVMRKAFAPVRPIVRMVGATTTGILGRSKMQPTVTTATTLISTNISTTSVRVSNADMRMVITAATSTVRTQMAVIASLVRS